MTWIRENWYRVSIIVLGLIALFIWAQSPLFNESKYDESERIKAEQNVVSPSPELIAAYKEASERTAMADIAELSCFPTSAFACGGGDCIPVAPGTYFFVDYGTEGGTYFRCDQKGCDPYPVKVVPSGEFTQFIPSQGQAMMLKVATGEFIDNKGNFIDIATNGTGAIISSGVCDFK